MSVCLEQALGGQPGNLNATETTRQEEKRTAFDAQRSWAGIPGPPDSGCVTLASRLTSLSFTLLMCQVGIKAPSSPRCRAGD